MIDMILNNIFYVLVFPGFLFACFAGLLLAGIDRKIVARMQKRVGPPILQPFYDFMKLLGKETIIPHAAAKRIFLAAPVAGLVSLIVTGMFIPVGGVALFNTTADIVVIIYLLIIPAVSIIVGGAASGSPYAGVGLSREMVAVVSYELPFIMILLAIAKKVGGDGGMTFAFADITAWQTANGVLIGQWALIPAALAMLLVIPAEVGSHPFDIAEAETEICEGTLVEYSGAPLAVYELSHAVKMFIMTALFTALFLGGITTGIVVLDVVIFLAICVVVTVLCMSLIHAITARLKVEVLFRFYWKIVTGLALLSLILVWLGL